MVEIVRYTRQPQFMPIRRNGHHQMLRCRAHSKRSGGKPCGCWAVTGYPVCYHHGARGGAPKGNQNGLMHGKRSAAAQAEQRAAAARRRELKAALESVETSLKVR